jgi:diadenosine tetraphosphatase ApaH/serine/threonine PP2A family protein phosphatase
MKIGIISDIHSNLEALEVVVEELQKRRVGKIICLGDVVGYGANPNECCNFIREVADEVILGNHDAVCVGMSSIEEFNEIAKQACRWTEENLELRNKKWLKSLPLILEDGGKIFVHSTPTEPLNWDYIFSLEEGVVEFLRATFEICFVGHSHLPYIFSKKGEEYKVIEKDKVRLDKKIRYIINPGSVGQPRDGDWRACFGIYDTVKGEFSFYRCNYNVEKTVSKILNAGLPHFLGERLMVGR